MIKKIKHFIIVIIIPFLNGCIIDIPFDIPLKRMEAPFTYEIVRNSRQVILTQEYPWEMQNMQFFNVIKNDSIWQMWYKGYKRAEKLDYVGYLCFATSMNGEKWDKTLIKNDINNVLSNIILSSDSISVLDQYVFYDEEEEIYRMIGAVIDDREITTNILESKNGIDWINKKKLFDRYYDTQFSVIKKDEKFYIYQREWYNGLRAVGRSIIDKNYNVIESPQIMLLSDDKDFPHIYNNAASIVDNIIILFPTLYNKDSDTIKLTVGFEYEDELYLTGFDITDDLYYEENVKWGNVSPGLIPTNELNTYWMYYYGTSDSHEKNGISPDNISKYYRIKIRIHPKG